MRVTIIHPCIGRRRGDRRYIRTWQMESLPAATLAGLTPRDVELRFYDDRMETIPLDEPTDLVALSVETYTAKRAYQIASDYRRRRVPVVMGGFHTSLCPASKSPHLPAQACIRPEDQSNWFAHTPHQESKYVELPSFSLWPRCRHDRDPGPVCLQ
jgi:hypothetical protein